MRDDLARLVPYDPDSRDVEVMLSANENPFGVPDDVRAEMLARMASVPVNRYPDAGCRRLRGLLAEMWGTAPARVAVGNGGDELIFNLLLAFGGAGRAAVVCPPAFSSYSLSALLTATEVRQVPLDASFAVDEGAVLAAASRASVVFLTSPNNPTGGLVRREFVRSLANATDALIVVDEAYCEFADPGSSCIPLVEECPNLCVLKTLSKAYALAGVRLGYVVSSKAVVDALLAVRQPYSVSRLDQVAAETAVEMRASFEPLVRALVEGRAALSTALTALADEAEAATGRRPLTVFPSQANFLLVRFNPEGCGGLTAGEIHERLATEHSVLVRDFSRTPGLAGCLRLTVGTPQENARLVAALRAVVGAPAAKEGE